jgi:hypothetical protein
MKFSSTLSICGILAVTLSSCATPTKLPEKDANGKTIEYVWFTPTGSNVPIKVPKDSVQLSDTEAAAQEKDLTDLQRNAPIAPPPSPGGK